MKDEPKNPDTNEKPLLLLAVTILPALLPVIADRIGHEVSAFFRRRRLKERAAQKEAAKEAAREEKKRLKVEKERENSKEEE